MVNVKQAVPDLIMLSIVNPLKCEDFLFREMHFPCQKDCIEHTCGYWRIFCSALHREASQIEM